jgi:putative oxidoreductase
MKQKITFVLSLLFGLLFINGGLTKFVNYIPEPKGLSKNLIDTMAAMMQIGWLMPLVGIVEIIGGVLIIIPKTRALGAIMLFPIMVGIFLTNTITDSSNLIMGVVLLVVLLWIIYDNRAKYLPMIGE